MIVRLPLLLVLFYLNLFPLDALDMPDLATTWRS